MDTLSEEVKVRLEKIRRKHGGILRPEDVVADAEKPSSPLHGHFTWSDEVAAAAYRLIEAGRLIARVRITIEEREEKTITVAKYQSIGGTDSKGRKEYGDVEEILADPQRRKALLLQALRELEAFQRRYSELEELAGVFAAIPPRAA